MRIVGVVSAFSIFKSCASLGSFLSSSLSFLSQSFLSPSFAAGSDSAAAWSPLAPDAALAPGDETLPVGLPSELSYITAGDTPGPALTSGAVAETCVASVVERDAGTGVVGAAVA
jgi:hypothetical protein